MVPNETINPRQEWQEVKFQHRCCDLTLFLETLSSPFYYAIDMKVSKYICTYIIYCTYLLNNYVGYPFELITKLQAPGIVET